MSQYLVNYLLSIILIIYGCIMTPLELLGFNETQFSETFLSAGFAIGKYNLDPLNRLLAIHNYKPLPDNWKFFSMDVYRSVLHSKNEAFFTYGISPNFDYYEASLNQTDNKYLNASIGFVQIGITRRMNWRNLIFVKPFLAYRSDILTIGYGFLSGSLGKNLQNPRPGQRSTGFVFSIVPGLSVEKSFCLNQFPSPENPFRFNLGFSLQTSLPVGRQYWYSNYSVLSGERFTNLLLGCVSFAVPL
jgi:hypothetical protein